MRKHKRSITFEGFKRSDGLWDIEGRLVDVKDEDFVMRSGTRKRGDPVHDISVRVTIDPDMNVLDVIACSDSTPFTGVCETVLPDYRQIVGLNLFNDFLRSVKALFGETAAARTSASCSWRCRQRPCSRSPGKRLIVSRSTRRNLSILIVVMHFRRIRKWSGAIFRAGTAANHRGREPAHGM